MDISAMLAHQIASAQPWDLPGISARARGTWAIYWRMWRSEYRSALAGGPDRRMATTERLARRWRSRMHAAAGYALGWREIPTVPQALANARRVMGPERSPIAYARVALGRYNIPRIAPLP